jgi:subtilisin family serine protease
MNPGMRRNRTSVSVFSFGIAVLLIGFLYATTPVTSSHNISSEYSGLFERGGKNARFNESVSRLSLQDPRERIAPKVLADTADGDSAPVVILLADQADLSAAYQMTDQDERGWYVYRTLTEHAVQTQASLKEFLKTNGVTYQSFWAANMLTANADRALLDKLSARDDVARIDSNAPTRWIEDPIVGKTGVTTNSLNAPEAAEWGVLNVNAPAVWALGFTGQGMVVANEDTGMRWTHSALKPKYRGWNGMTADHNFNWHDSIHSGGGICGSNSPAPCDDSGHGTHTTGTTVGDDGAGNQIGVAPGAKWIGCRNMDQGNGTPATYTECFQFFIAPTDLAGNNANPNLRPHVINNSWGCPASEGCVTRAELETIANNTQAAGIFLAMSAGNSGPGCSSVSDAPSIYSASFSAGAIDISNVLASFSSRGPSTFYTPNLLKPNLSAPGVNVRSTTPTSDTSYGNLSGTSMASPHVAGVVALLWSARPTLVRNIAATKALLQATANPLVTVTPQTCGGTPSTQIPNNSFGYGRIDALAAVNAVPTAAAGSISGHVASADGTPLAGVIITLAGAAARKTISDNYGNYRVDGVAPGGFYTVTPSRVNYSFEPNERALSLGSNSADATFVAATTATVSANPVDVSEYFVRQHYLDFLGREPDESGFNFWSDQILDCAADAACIERKRINVSAAYFLSIEFQQIGGLVDGLYRVSFDRRPFFAEFMPDTAGVSNGIVVGETDWPARLEANKHAFIEAWMQRAAFRAGYDGLGNSEFVDGLISHAAGFDGDRNALVSGLNQDTVSRAAVLRQVVENDGFARAKLNRMFVMMEYFGYLRRDPDDAGYRFWLDKLNGFGGNFEQAEMVKAFIVSSEYRARFPR